MYCSLLSLLRAVGNKMYGTQYHDQISETVRKAAEFCDSLQSFFIIHSMGGGKEGREREREAERERGRERRETLRFPTLCTKHRVT